jgi:hypothetical protein
MRLRLILQPAWVRFVVWALFLAVWWGLFTSLQSSYEFESAVLSGIVFGAALGGYSRRRPKACTARPKRR